MSAATTVTAEVYAESVCGHVGSVADLSEQLGGVVLNAVEAFKAAPTQANAIALRDAFVVLLDETARAADEALTAIRDAGKPDVKRGARFAKAVIAHLRESGDAIHALAEQASAIDVNSVSGFAADFDRVRNTVLAIEQREMKQAARDPAFKNPPESLRPVVAFMTTDAPRCASEPTAI